MKRIFLLLLGLSYLPVLLFSQTKESKLGRFSFSVSVGKGTLANTSQNEILGQHPYGNQGERLSITGEYLVWSKDDFNVCIGGQYTYSKNGLAIPIGIPDYFEGYAVVSYNTKEYAIPVTIRLPAALSVGKYTISLSSAILPGYSLVTNTYYSDIFRLVETSNETSANFGGGIEGGSRYINVDKSNSFILAGKIGFGVGRFIRGAFVEANLFYLSDFYNKQSFYATLPLHEMVFDNYYAARNLQFERHFSPKWASWNLMLRFYI